MFFFFLSPLCFFFIFVQGQDVFHLFCPHNVFVIFVQGHDVFQFFVPIMFLGAKSTSIRDCVRWLVGRSVGWSVGPSPRSNYVEN